MKSARITRLNFLTLALMLAMFLTACGPSNTVRLLSPAPAVNPVLPAPNAPRVTVVPFTDNRQDTTNLGVRRDGSAFVASDDLAQSSVRVGKVSALLTPLTSIISYTELLQQEEGLPDHVQDYIRVLSDKSKRLQVMVRDVFEVSKAATGNLSVDIKPIDFAKLLRQTLADMGEAIEESGLALRPRLPESPVWIAADGDRLYRVFQNLIGNALKYSLEGSRIYLELTAADGQAAAVLRNTSREELPDGVDLTERFVRGDESRTDGGSGLGLSIARTFTEACGGTFSVQTQADLFTASVSFPLTRERPPKEESAV